MLKKIVLVTPATMFAAAAIKKDVPEPPTTPESVANEHYKCKASDLPMYAPLHSFNPPKRQSHPPKDSELHKTLESGVRIVRQEVQKGVNLVSDQLSTVEDYWNTAKAHTQSSIDYLNEPQNTLPRGGAIAIGGLAGFIFAARGGFIKKVLYTSIGAGAIASLCYPRQAEKVAQETLFEARKLYAITYNFVKGVKPGDEVPTEPINKFPTSLEEIKFLMYDIYDEAKEMLFPKKK